MKINHKPNSIFFKHWKFNRRTIFGTSIISFVAGLLLAQLIPSNQVKADNNQVYELLVYHAVPGKAAALESRFRTASKLQEKHNINAIGYWIPKGNPEWENTFIYIVGHSSLDEAKKNWNALHADPAFQDYVKSEKAEKLIETVDRTYMRPADFRQSVNP